MYKGKRLFDIIAALLGLVLLAPLMCLIALLIHITMPGPIFFKQQRPGLYGRPFELYKFRTMRPKKTPLEPDTARLTALGQLLRKTSLDELPELWNVLRGEMSLVGPRPLLMEYVPLYNQEQTKRMHVLPGITGLAQINGRNAIDWDTKFTYDLWYVEHLNFWLDIKILCKTFWVVFRRQNINQSPNITMEKFDGNSHKPKLD